MLEVALYRQVVWSLVGSLAIGCGAWLFKPALFAAGPDSDSAALPEQPNFSRDIQPILAANCVSCHGGVKQAADISFVDAGSYLPPEGWIIEPGNAEDSELFLRVTSTDDDVRMPPPGEHSHPLSANAIELIRRWINQGAKWEDHCGPALGTQQFDGGIDAPSVKCSVTGFLSVWR